MEGDKKPVILVTGASGLLGRAVMKIIKERNWNAIGLAYSRITEGLVKCDLTDTDNISEVLLKYKPDFIVHAAAERMPDRVENNFEQTKRLNITATETIASIAKSIGSKLIYISTDYVFDGSNPPYNIDDEPRPLNKYGQTKLEGEKSVTKTYVEGSCILRIPILYGPVEYLNESAVTCLMSLLLSTKTESVSHYERRYPSHVDDISNVVCDLVSAMQKDSSLCGTFQWSGLEMLTKYDMIVSIAKALSLDHSHIQPNANPTPGAARPYDSHMDNSRLLSLNISHHSTFHDSVKEVLLPWKNKSS